MCGTMKKDEVRYEVRYLVVVGGEDHNGALSSCEYIDFPSQDWKKCKDLPEPLVGGQLVNDPETGDLLLLGGSNGNQDMNTIYRLSNIDEDWVLQEEHHMKVGRRRFSAIVVPDDVIICDKSINKHDEL